MKTRLAVVCALLLVLGTPASAHRLDEYLQATTLSVMQDHIAAQMRLTPGVAVFRKVFANMDTNADGVLAATEQRHYAERVLGDLSLTLDGHSLRLQLVSWKFPQTAEMRAGRGEIELDFNAPVSRSNRSRSLVFENHHQSRIAVYLVNCLVPQDPNIQVTAQHRNYQQSRYQLEYVQLGVSSADPSLAGYSRNQAWLIATALLLFAPLAGLWRWRVRKNRVLPHKTALLKSRGA